MTDPFSTHSPTDITGEACAWIAQLESGRFTKADKLALEEWMYRSPAHHAEIKRLSQLSLMTNMLSDLGPSLSSISKERQKMVKKPRLYTVAAPALTGVLCLMFLFGAWFMDRKDVGDVEPYVVATAVGQFISETLPDGTIVTLNTDSQIEVEFEKDKRWIRMIQGEAEFKVAHNPDRPFVVTVADKQIMATGTAFSVRWTTGDLTVLVTEGSVEYAKNTSLKTEKNYPVKDKIDPNFVKPVRLSAGQKLVISDVHKEAKVAEVSKKNLRQELAWQSGVWDFSDQTLTEVIAEMGRYTDIRVEIQDPELGDVKFDGLFRTDDLNGLFEALDVLPGIELKKVTEKQVVIRREP